MAKFGRLRDDGRSPGLHPLHPRNCLIFLLHFTKKYTMGKIKENWQIIVFTAFITMIFSVMLTFWTNRESKLSGAASEEYVEKTNNDLKTYIDVQDGEIKGRVKVLEDRQIFKADKADIDKLDHKIEEQTRLITDQNKMIIDIWKEIKK